RMRIGVGNRILNNHKIFINSAQSLIDELKDKGYLKEDSKVLELGCGCGRNALAFIKFLTNKGNYIGQDVDKEMINWCTNNLEEENIKFFHADLFSKVYNPNGKRINEYLLPCKDNSITIIVSVSVFSHLLYNDFKHYIVESNRVLASNGILHMTLFLLDFIQKRINNRWTFKHKVDNCYIENVQYPEAAVGYELKTVEDILNSNGLSIVEIYNKDSYQPTLIARKN
ncbi:MAG TPA: class I SAM-dependent methyltransferase, partial [Ignavibacteriaceae bacterium]|nr:class I SAM-dependent methyltransferase [Ignavibacteriaceae bacterium]